MIRLRETAILAAVLSAALSCADNGLYDWEKNRREIPIPATMTLCYGGSSHRDPYLWDEDRFAPMVTYTDTSGSEQWLFESFLALEFTDDAAQLSYCIGTKHPTADRASWTRLLDYWFQDETGFGGLDKAVGSAIGRIGKPQTKRQVILSLPEPIINQDFLDSTSNTVFWGELDGRTIDFKNPQDRRDVMKWYIDEARRRFHEHKYKNIELIGFYVIQECIMIPGDGWNPGLKKYLDLFPAIPDYLHSINEGIYWIPYYEANPYTQLDRLHFDLVMMQPNHFWDDDNSRPMDKFFKMINGNGMGMELEFDHLLLGSDEKAMMYKERLRDYLREAKAQDVYQKKPISLYSGTNAFYDLAHSRDAADVEMFNELCEFILGQNNL